MSYAIQVQGLRKSFRGQEAVKGIEFEVRKGELLALLGPNGAGKTTTIHMLSTLLPPDSGSAWIAGFDVVKQPKEVRARISLTGQFAALDEGLTGLQNLRMIARLHGYPAKEAREIAGHLLESFGLTEAGNRIVQGYSGGMRRRLDIAAGIVSRPEILFLDEPTTGLDPRSRQGVWETVRLLLAQGTTILLTTQDLEEADQLADRIALMDQGTMIAKGTSRELKTWLGGKTLELILTEPADPVLLTRLLADSSGRSNIRSDERLVYRIPVDNAAHAGQLVQSLLETPIGIESFSLKEPTLDEVFLALTRDSRDGAVTKRDSGRSPQ
ncbi:ATP-binding cassette domain-containing protein [Paenibacillus sp. alder61]|uniref:ATP-binding cassette domain-containing protein n=1 Tax=Paenibacillus faecis TaxID=862114 RepID=A0A5D0CXM0_9BACL|nr:MULTISPECIES: ATP-binding cassette domain-containing protein [Paenibacillus]MCA1295469.1 ATP-binding cassette domain-containing protein [Paenibacillus sp. alder61]TYA14463.1 ATP-binding cassette domain-containing protein [Paenibacillus faecis]